ncbi:MOSC domain-containing protein [Ancylothrix sp. C2]|uniref:MOSC domain-containing protein n=1 Tax=Ancylothrix sp. D3o TaxID=2953691 RepID=UPI0021BAB769|nr:MOSC domain-containing protein [Ancylothrix sp. D3o]MCT7949491.1 MOSC domain-containing protein [Ancylothrix sp. D3o]
MTSATVQQIFTYPIKGLTPHPTEKVILKIQHGITGDRAFALMYAEDGTQPPEIIPWMSKGNFAMQNDWPGLAALECYYDHQTGNLTVKHNGVLLLKSETFTQAGRNLISAFFTGYLASLTPTDTARHPQKAPLYLVGNTNGESRYPDREPVHISLVSQATLDTISQATNHPADVRRFRPNFVIQGVSAWEEFNWIGQQFQLGTATISVTARIGRCVNIEVNPETGIRDIPLFSLLPKKFGHAQTGVLATVINSGSVAIGDSLIPA